VAAVILAQAPTVPYLSQFASSRGPRRRHGRDLWQPFLANIPSGITKTWRAARKIRLPRGTPTCATAWCVWQSGTCTGAASKPRAFRRNRGRARPPADFSTPASKPCVETRSPCLVFVLIVAALGVAVYWCSSSSCAGAAEGALGCRALAGRNRPRARDDVRVGQGCVAALASAKSGVLAEGTGLRAQGRAAPVAIGT